MTAVAILVAFLAGVVVASLVASTMRRSVGDRSDSGPFQTLLHQAWARLVSDDAVGAAERLKQAVETCGDDPAATLLLAEALRRNGEWHRAERALEVLAARQDLDAETRSAQLQLQGRVFEQTDRIDEALVCYEQAAAELPQAAAPLIALERTLTRLERWPEAIAASARLQKLVPERGKLITARRRVLHAIELLADGRANDAKREAQTALGEAPNLAAAQLTLGDALFQLKDVRGAHQAWIEAAREAPHITALTLDRLEGGGSALDREAARRFAQDMIEREATGVSSWRLYAWLADESLARRDLGGARPWIDRIEQAAPRSATAQRLRVRLANFEDGEKGARLMQVTARWRHERLWWDPWRCVHCGQSRDEFEWRCSQCQAWESMA